ncbi:hypothetical protein HDU97_005755 [Phlyctochytrium planicorne]|nr:hypothetical protein HDU97_005755 [Phlyctochytrium planicorne]
MDEVDVPNETAEDMEGVEVLDLEAPPQAEVNAESEEAAEFVDADWEGEAEVETFADAEGEAMLGQPIRTDDDREHAEFQDAGESSAVENDAGEEDPANAAGPAETLGNNVETNAAKAEGDATESSNPDGTTANVSSLHRRLLMNPNKAVDGGVSNAVVQQVSYEKSKGSRYYKKEEEKDEKLQRAIEENKKRMAALTEEELAKAKIIVDEKVKEMEDSRDLSRMIVHIDMDAYYASVEELERPDLKTKAVAVGGLEKGSVLCTANYMARLKGVRSAMPVYIAKNLCPELIIIPPNFHKYSDITEKIREVMRIYDPNLLPVSLDEAYLDITNYLTTVEQTPDEVVEEIRAKIFEKTGLTASGGIGANKMLAKLGKICSGVKKPNGQFRLENDRDTILAYLKNLSIRKVSGIGRVTEQIMNGFGIFQCGEIMDKLPAIKLLMSPSGFETALHAATGVFSNVVEKPQGLPLSKGRERTYKELKTLDEMLEKLKLLAEDVGSDFGKDELQGRALTLKVKDSNFNCKTRLKTLHESICSSAEIYKHAEELMRKFYEPTLKVRLLGISLSKLSIRGTEDPPNLHKFFKEEENAKRVKDDLIETACPICQKPLTGRHVTDFSIHLEACLMKQELASRNAKRKHLEIDSDQKKTQVKRARMERKPKASHDDDFMEDGGLDLSLSCSFCSNLIDGESIMFLEHLQRCVPKWKEDIEKQERSENLPCPTCGANVNTEEFGDHHQGCLTTWIKSQPLFTACKDKAELKDLEAIVDSLFSMPSPELSASAPLSGRLIPVSPFKLADDDRVGGLAGRPDGKRLTPRAKQYVVFEDLNSEVDDDIEEFTSQPRQLFEDYGVKEAEKPKIPAAKKPEPAPKKTAPESKKPEPKKPVENGKDAAKDVFPLSVECPVCKHLINAQKESDVEIHVERCLIRLEIEKRKGATSTKRSASAGSSSTTKKTQSVAKKKIAANDHGGPRQLPLSFTHGPQKKSQPSPQKPSPPKIVSSNSKKPEKKVVSIDLEEIEDLPDVNDILVALAEREPSPAPLTRKRDYAAVEEDVTEVDKPTEEVAAQDEPEKATKQTDDNALLQQAADEAVGEVEHGNVEEQNVSIDEDVEMEDAEKIVEEGLKEANAEAAVNIENADAATEPPRLRDEEAGKLEEVVDDSTKGNEDSDAVMETDELQKVLQDDTLRSGDVPDALPGTFVCPVCDKDFGAVMVALEAAESKLQFEEHVAHCMTLDKEKVEEGGGVSQEVVGGELALEGEGAEDDEEEIDGNFGELMEEDEFRYLTQDPAVLARAGSRDM